jgi:hypothetical protein
LLLLVVVVVVVVACLKTWRSLIALHAIPDTPLALPAAALQPTLTPPPQGKRSLFLGPVGSGARMKLVVNMTMGAMMSACDV